MDPKVVEALRLQQEDQNQKMLEMDEFYRTQQAEMNEVVDALLIQVLSEGGGDNV